MHCNKSKIELLEKNHAKLQENLKAKERQRSILDAEAKFELKILREAERKLKKENELLKQDDAESENKNNDVKKNGICA